jgi:hypothetical protein
LKKLILSLLILCLQFECYSWGFYGHKKINNYAVFLLPPQMLVFYKPHIDFITEHAVDPDMRRYAIAQEGARHYIDIDKYGKYPFEALPRKWNDARDKFSEDSLQKHGIVPWWVQTMLFRLTNAFKEKNQVKILKLSAEIGHYIADAHVPLHANSNHNGQYTNQQGIHGFWESRVPELLADKEWDFFIGKADYIKDPGNFIWQRVLESVAAADTVLRYEKELSEQFPADQKFSFENRNGTIIRQYSSAFTKAYDLKLKGMVERRMRMAIYSVASFWYTAWVNAGEPDLTQLSNKEFSADDLKEFETLSNAWRNNKIKGEDREE